MIQVLVVSTILVFASPISLAESQADTTMTWGEAATEAVNQYPLVDPSFLGKKMQACYKKSDVRSDVLACFEKSMSPENLTYGEQLMLTTAHNRAVTAKDTGDLFPDTVELPLSSTDSLNSEKNEIVTRCRDSMEEHGAAMVKACADRDIAALNELNNYPQEYQPAIAQCMERMIEHGYAMVKACADRDIEAEKALSRY